MTENEALMILENLKPRCGERLVFPEGEICEAIDISITALKEVHQYREIGTVEECREAMKKQKLKKILRKLDFNGVKYFVCPTCLIAVNGDGTMLGYCFECGQKLNFWEVTENE